MTRALDLAGSTLHAVWHEHGQLVVALEPARIVEYRDGQRRAPHCHSQRVVELRCSSPAPVVVIEHLPAQLVYAAVMTAARRYEQLLPLPLVFGGPTALHLQTAAGEHLRIRGTGVAIVFPRRSLGVALTPPADD